MEQVKVVLPLDMKRAPHPQVCGAEVAYLATKRDENMDLTCMLVHPRPGTRVAKHGHECDEIIHVIKGNAMMRIDGMRDIPMPAETFLRVPKGITHQSYNLAEDFIAYDIFYPLLVWAKTMSPLRGAPGRFSQSGVPSESNKA